MFRKRGSKPWDLYPRGAGEMAENESEPITAL